MCEKRVNSGSLKKGGKYNLLERDGVFTVGLTYA
jgi:hypothetical protein